MKLVIFILTLAASCFISHAQPVKLNKAKNHSVLLVDGKPFHILGGELGNSTATWMPLKIDSVFANLKQLNLNTVLVPVYWELVEPKQGVFNFESTDRIISIARRHDLKLVFLWFGSWKNSMSCYAPEWIKTNRTNYPYIKTKDGNNQEIMSPFAQSNLTADLNAFTALMKHLGATDKDYGTVLMVQVENEIGMIPEPRDYSTDANRHFNSNVPAALTDYLIKNKETLHPQLLKKWQSSNFAINKQWTSTFGDDIYTEEIFMAWHFGLYVETLASAGKKAYNIPMFLNAALNSRGRLPGEYPSAGPLDHLMDIWRAAAPSIDLLAPDIYDPGFKNWCSKYNRDFNPLFIPEIRLDDANAMQVFYAIGEHGALGFSPFSIEDSRLEDNPLSKSYSILAKLQPTIAQKQMMDKVRGVYFDNETRDTIINMNSYSIQFKHDYTLGWDSKAKDGSKWPESGAIIIELAEGEYLVAGTGIVVTFGVNGDNKLKTGILSIDDIDIRDGQFVRLARMNGDQNHQGRHLRIPVGQWGIQHVKLYKY
jgi:hypothetical protein